MSSSSASSRLKNQVALITGGNRGIGAGIARSLAAEGAAVTINYHTHREEAETLREEIRADGGRAIAVQADVSKSADVSRLVEETRSSLGSVSICVNNAGVARPRSIEEVTVEDWNEAIAVNLSSMFLVTQAVLPDMRQARFGRLIFLSSVAAQLGGVVGPHYAASKAGAIGLAHSYANLLRSEGITSNAISPALVKTPMIDGNPAVRPDVIPVGRLGEVEEVADAALLLATNGYITGQNINVNGGWYMSS